MILSKDLLSQSSLKKVSEVCNLYLGGTPKTSISEFWNGDIKWATAKDVSNCQGRYIGETERKITLKATLESNAKIYPKGTIVITARGTVGKIAILSMPMAFNQTCYGLVVKPQSDSMYVFYSLKNSLADIGTLSYGTVFQTITTKTFDEILIKVPPLKDQKAIAKILSDLDSKIELNQKMNRTLESIAQAIFKHWFVDFEFPNEEGKPYRSSGGEMVDSELGEIPKGWDVGSLGSVLSLLKDGTHLPPKRVAEGLKFIAGATDIKHFYVDFSKCSYITEDEYLKIHKKWDIRPNDILLTIVGTIGNAAIVRERDLPFSMQRSIALLRVNEKIPYSYLYFFVNSNYFKKELEKRINPTAQPGIYLTELSKVKIIVPNKKIVELFHNVAQSFIKLMQFGIDNIEVLTGLRDSLIPKLISGKIRVPVEE